MFTGIGPFKGYPIEYGTAQGQMAFWDATRNTWAHTETSELFWDDTGKNFGLKTATFGTNGVGVFGIGNGTAPTTSPANMAQMWVQDYAAGDARFYFMGEANQDKVIIGGGHLELPSVNDAATPTLNFGGNSGFYESEDNRIRISLNGAEKWDWNGNDFKTLVGTNGCALSGATPSATTPVHTFADDWDTGMGRHSADNLSLVAGGAEAIRAEDPADLAATETSLWLYDKDNNTVEQVTVGAADSGGAGFKVLRIPN